MLRRLTSGPAHPSTLGPVSLANIQVDVTTRLGAATKPIGTGFARLDALFGGGLRPGSVLAITGAPGSGRTAVALTIAYMAARASVGVVFAARGLQETELVARLAARAVRRAYPSSGVTYADILFGNAFGDDEVRKAVNDAVETVVRKVGQHLHFARLGPTETCAELLVRCTPLWARYERAVLVVDDLEGVAASDTRPLESRLTSAAYDLENVAMQGVGVVCTALQRHAELIAPASTMLVGLSVDDVPSGRSIPVDFDVRKNRYGARTRFRLQAVFGAGEFNDSRISAWCVRIGPKSGLMPVWLALFLGILAADAGVSCTFYLVRPDTPVYDAP